jgi:ABC-type transporter Mla maintaining outer membrane lipid asymmetry ATPase subunit MlaF
LLFDKPINGLDPEGILWVRRLLRSLADEGRTMYLPSSAGVAMSARVRFPNLLSPAGGLAVLAGYTLATLALAMLMIERRDA